MCADRFNASQHPDGYQNPRSYTETRTDADKTLFQAGFEQAPIGIAHLSSNGHILQANRRLCFFLGYSREEMIQQTLTEMSVLNEYDQDYGLLQQIFRGELKTSISERQLIDKQGQRHWARMTISPAYFAEETPAYLIAIIEDINDRKQLEAQLFATEQKAGENSSIPATFATMAEGIFVYDERARLIHINTANGKLVMRDITEQRRMERELEQRTQESLDTLLRMAESLVELPEGLTEENRYSDLATRNVMQRLAELTRSIMRKKQVGIVAIDPQNQTLQPIVVVGGTPEQEQQWWQEVSGLRPDQRTIDSKVLSRLQANEALIVNIPKEQQQESESKTPLAILAPMTTENQLIGILALDYDAQENTYTREDLALAKAIAKLAALVLERERLLQEREKSMAQMLALHETNQRMDKFISIASHELKTPITTIKGYIQLVSRRLKTAIHAHTEEEERQKKSLSDMLTRMETQIDRLIRLENDLLDVSRIKADRLDLNLEDFNFLEAVQDIVNDHRELYGPREITLTLPEESKLPVHADPERIGQVVTNYLTNALKYSPPNKSVEVCVRLKDNHAYLSVIDEGPGLPEKEHEKIWDSFYRVRGIDIQSGSGVGLGLGLHICRTIVEHHQGQYGIESKPGQGSKFWFSIPLTEEQQKTA